MRSAVRLSLYPVVACIALSALLAGCWKIAPADAIPGTYASNSEPGSSVEIRGDGTFTERRGGATSNGSWAMTGYGTCPNIRFRRLGGGTGGHFDPESTTCIEAGWGEIRIVIDADLGHYYSRDH